MWTVHSLVAADMRLREYTHANIRLLGLQRVTKRMGRGSWSGVYVKPGVFPERDPDCRMYQTVRINVPWANGRRSSESKETPKKKRSEEIESANWEIVSCNAIPVTSQITYQV